MAIAHIAQHGPRQNYLLAALPESSFQHLLPQLAAVQLESGQMVDDSRGLPHAWFPATCVLSMQYTTSEGYATEVACIGNEGMTGIGAVMSGERLRHPLVVRSAGIAYRLPVRTVIDEFRRCEQWHNALLRYIQALLAQIMQTAACNRYHSIDQQFCRWLLTTLDRQATNQLSLTQEAIANTLGVRRESITEAARKLQRAGAIHYSRGHITVDDRSRLEAGACECYGLVRQEFERMQDRRIAA